MGIARLAATVAGLLVVLAAADSAPAATVEVRQVAGRGYPALDVVALRAAAGERNDVTMTSAQASVVVRDRVPLAPGAGCVAAEAGAVRCAVTPQQSISLVLRLGDGDDRARVDGAGGATMHGGPGDDALTALMDGASDFVGGPGDDRMEGGLASDHFMEGDRANGSDTMLGGPPGPVGNGPFTTFDVVHYQDRTRRVRADLQGDRDDGEASERDRIGSDVEWLVGGAGPDVLTGGPRADTLLGLDGRDVLRGAAGGDLLVGDYGNVRSAPGPEDRLFGGSGRDELDAGMGDDAVAGGAGRDWVDAGPGSDRVLSRDRETDAVLCGRGFDRVSHDGIDFLDSRCERHGTRLPPRALPLRWTDADTLVSIVMGCPANRKRRCEGLAALEVSGRVVGSVTFSLAPGSARYAYVPIAGRSREHPEPALDDAVLVITSTDARGQSARVAVPLAQVPENL